MHTYERYAYEIAYGMCARERHAYETAPMRDTSMRGLWEMHAYKRHAYGMASVRSTPMRDTPMKVFART